MDSYITVDFALKAEDVVATIWHVRALRGTPERIQVDNGSEFISLTLDQWAYEQGVTLDFSRPGKLTNNLFIDWLVHLAARNLQLRSLG